MQNVMAFNSMEEGKDEESFNDVEGKEAEIRSTDVARDRREWV